VVRGLFVEPFYGGSHRAFLDGLVRSCGHEVELLTLPEGEWRRRMRRGAQELAPLARRLPGEFDFLVVSDMLDLPAFLALTRPMFERTPVLAYFHENQMTYPRLRGTKFNSWFGQINFMTALAADAVAFNSAFHREDFLVALRALLAQPNNWLTEAGVDEVEQKSFVLPVGVDLGWIEDLAPRPQQRLETEVRSSPRTILWNHRWEFDKAPELFARALRALRRRGVPFKLIVAGEPGDNPSAAITSLPEEFGECIEHFGYAASKEEYGRLLWRSDIVVSTTRHEFFGVGMVEAMAAGCVPCAPRRYNYPALVPPDLHGDLLWEDEDGLVGRLERLLNGELPPRTVLQAAARRYEWSAVGAEWGRVISRLSHREFATKPQGGPD
jgi:glycosyltransferase involved in cell wall biosynthesis